MIEDDGPSLEDLDRFDSETAYCPDCGEEIWDLVEVCPECGAHLPDGPQRDPPDQSAFQARWIAVVIVLVILGLLGLSRLI